jgi:heme-degrading monooxygenase HmoA
MPASPWKRLREVEAEREYIVWVTYIPVRRFAKTPQFLSAVWKIRKQLDRSEGLVGYSLRAKPFSSDYWTLSVWESDAAVRFFTQGQPHRRVAQQMSSFATTGFALSRWTAVGSAVPPTWDDALAHLAPTTGE